MRPTRIHKETVASPSGKSLGDHGGLCWWAGSTWTFGAKWYLKGVNSPSLSTDRHRWIYGASKNGLMNG